MPDELLAAQTSVSRRWQPWLFSATAALVVGFALVLWAMGREPLSDSGFGLWTGAKTPNTSQWMVDPYSTSHVLHGLFFYLLLFPFRGRLPLAARFLIASGIEVGWEILENTPLVIDRYRTATASLEYYGDSILNSVCDLFSAMLGFVLAAWFRWPWMVLLVAAVELSMLYFVRDNLTLNVLMLLWPLDAVRQWQMGG